MANPHYIFVILIICFNYSCKKHKIYGQVKIAEISSYDKEDSYFPHDCKSSLEFVEKPFELKKLDNNILIKNGSNDGFTGHYIKIELNENLEIIDLDYQESSDVIDGSETTFEVDSIDLILDSNPFQSKNVVGYYSLFLTQYYYAGKSKEIGGEDNIFKRVFKGKFKNCESEMH